MASLSNYIQTNFPSPMEGDEFLWGGVRYIYDATPGIWTGAIPDPDAVQDVATNEAPEDPINGELWYDSSTERMNVRVDGAWVDANPQPTAEDLGIMPAVATQNNGTLVELTTTVLNFGAGLDAEISAVGEVTIDSELPSIPAAQETIVGNYTLRVPTSGDPEWVSVADAADTITLDDLDGVSAPLSSPSGFKHTSF